jgi:hypothetical protein
MPSFPRRFYADIGLRLATVWEPIGDELRLVASSRLNPRRFDRSRWLDADDPRAAPPRAILFAWADRQPIH